MDGEATYLSYEELRPGGVPDAMRRLYWPLEGEFPLNMFVMKQPRAPRDLEPLFQPDDSGNGNSNSGTWHEIASQPCTKRKVSSITARVPELDQWGPHWRDWHGEHACPESGAEYITDDREADADAKVLIRCCGEERPFRKGHRSITVVPLEGSGFVTVKDYVCSTFNTETNNQVTIHSNKRLFSCTSMADEFPGRYYTI